MCLYNVLAARASRKNLNGFYCFMAVYSDVDKKHINVLVFFQKKFSQISLSNWLSLRWNFAVIYELFVSLHNLSPSAFLYFLWFHLLSEEKCFSLLFHVQKNHPSLSISILFPALTMAQQHTSLNIQNTTA